MDVAASCCILLTRLTNCSHGPKPKMSDHMVVPIASRYFRQTRGVFCHRSLPICVEDVLSQYDWMARLLRRKRRVKEQHLSKEGFALCCDVYNACSTTWKA